MFVTRPEISLNCWVKGVQRAAAESLRDDGEAVQKKKEKEAPVEATGGDRRRPEAAEARI